MLFLTAFSRSIPELPQAICLLYCLLLLTAWQFFFLKSSPNLPGCSLSHLCLALSNISTKSSLPVLWFGAFFLPFFLQLHLFCLFLFFFFSFLVAFYLYWYFFFLFLTTSILVFSKSQISSGFSQVGPHFLEVQFFRLDQIMQLQLSWCWVERFFCVK